MEESESLSDLDLENPPKLTFEELKSIAMKDLKQLRTRTDLLKALYYYCKDCTPLFNDNFISKEAFKNNQILVLPPHYSLHPRQN
jgi:hypothetical protein